MPKAIIAGVVHAPDQTSWPTLVESTGKVFALHHSHFNWKDVLGCKILANGVLLKKEACASKNLPPDCDLFFIGSYKILAHSATPAQPAKGPSL